MTGPADSTDRFATSLRQDRGSDREGTKVLYRVGVVLSIVALMAGGCLSSTSSPESTDSPTTVQCDTPPTGDELRGVWLTNVDSDVLDSRENIEEAMAFLAEHNFNVVFPVVWNDAATMYPSTVMDTLVGRRIDP